MATSDILDAKTFQNLALQYILVNSPHLVGLANISRKLSKVEIFTGTFRTRPSPRSNRLTKYWVLAMFKLLKKSLGVYLDQFPSVQFDMLLCSFTRNVTL